jgi:drug/metabolite transporter (DMT)-like permease
MHGESPSIRGHCGATAASRQVESLIAAIKFLRMTCSGKDARAFVDHAKAPPLSSDRTAMLLALAAIFLLTVMDSIIKSLAVRFNAAEIMFFRQGIGAFFAFGLFVWFRPGWPSRAQWKGHFTRTLIMMATGLMFFHALGKMPLAELFVYTFTAPMFVALFGGLILKERLTGPVALGLGLGFCGILVIVLTDPNARFGGGSPDGLAAAILSPITYALAMVLLRKQAGSEPVPRIVFVQSLITAGLISVFVLPAPPALEGGDIAKAVAIAALGTVGNFLLAMAFSKAEAAKVIVAEYTGMIWAALLGFVFFAETPRLMVWIGGALVIVGCAAVARGRREAPPVAA